MEVEALVQDCRGHGISFPVVSLGGGRTLIVRGVCTGGYVPCRNPEVACDDDYATLTQAQRSVHVTWSLLSKNDKSKALQKVSGIHYIATFDTSNRWFLFAEDVLVTYPQTATISISVVFGPWAGHGAHFFELAGQRDKATAAAATVMSVLPVQGIL